MKPLKNSLPLQGKFDVSPRAHALQGKPLQSFWNWPSRSSQETSSIDTLKVFTQKQTPVKLSKPRVFSFARPRDVSKKAF